MQQLTVSQIIEIIIYCPNVPLYDQCHVRSTTFLQWSPRSISGSQTVRLRFWILRCRFLITGTGFPNLSVEFQFLIPIVNGIPDSLNCIPDFPKPKIPDSTSKNSPNPNSLTCTESPGRTRVLMLKQLLQNCLLYIFFTLINRSLVTLLVTAKFRK